MLGKNERHSGDAKSDAFGDNLATETVAAVITLLGSFSDEQRDGRLNALARSRAQLSPEPEGLSSRACFVWYWSPAFLDNRVPKVAHAVQLADYRLVLTARMHARYSTPCAQPIVSAGRIIDLLLDQWRFPIEISIYLAPPGII
jgi:hypothetical protein